MMIIANLCGLFQIRHTIGDFGVPIAIAIMVGVDMAFPSVFTQKLNVPEGLHVTAPEKRGWFISPMGIKETLPIWVPFVSVFPAILLYLVIFMETSICE
jgi:solute carrier family 4 (anion exchanger), member 2